MSVVKDAHSEFAALREGGHDALGLFPPVRSMEEGYRRDSKEVVRGFTLKAKTTRPAHVNLAFYLLLPHQRPPSRSNYFIRQIAAGRFSSPDFPHPGMLTRSSTVRLLPHSGERTERALDASDPKPTDDLVDGKFVFQEGIHWHYVRERGRIRIVCTSFNLLTPSTSNKMELTSTFHFDH